jgi:4-hydroxybenzoate polyprenyltransferase
MSENLPPPPVPEPPRKEREREPVSFWAMFALGIGLVIISIVSCLMFNHPFPLFIGGAVALGSLFFDGWRGIFVGAATLIGVVVLGVVIVCGSMGAVNMR